MTTTYLHGALQIVFALAVLAGVYLLAGLGWALVVAGGAGLATSVLVEYATARAQRAAPPARNPIEAL